MTTTQAHLAAMRTEILARIAAAKVPGDIAYWQAIFDRLAVNVGTCANDLIDQEARTATALTNKTNATTLKNAAGTNLLIATATLNAKLAAIQDLQDAIDALPNAGTALQRAERDALQELADYYGLS